FVLRGGVIHTSWPHCKKLAPVHLLQLPRNNRSIALCLKLLASAYSNRCGVNTIREQMNRRARKFFRRIGEFANFPARVSQSLGSQARGYAGNAARKSFEQLYADARSASDGAHEHGISL